MADPTTSLDPRFSDPGAAPTTWADTERILQEAELFWLTTVRSDGRPHASPLVAVWLDGALHIATGPEEQKAVNLRANRQVLLSTGAGRWDRGVDVVVEGEAAPVTDGPTLRRLATAWESKWDGRWRFEADADGFRHEAGRAVVFAITPSTVLAFGKGVFTQTRHRF